jgi:hypothetical protein
MQSQTIFKSIVCYDNLAHALGRALLISKSGKMSNLILYVSHLAWERIISDSDFACFDILKSYDTCLAKFKGMEIRKMETLQKEDILFTEDGLTLIRMTAD